LVLYFPLKSESVREATQSKSNTPQTKNVNKSFESRGSQPSLQPKSPNYAPSNSKSSNRTSSNPRGSIQAKPSQEHANPSETVQTRFDQSERSTSRPKLNQATNPKTREPQVDVQTRNGLGPQDAQTDNELQSRDPEDQNSKGSGNNADNNHEDEKCSK